MAQTLLRGTQILDGSITAAKFATGLALPTSQLADGASFLKKDGTVSMVSSLNMGGNTITNVGTPVNPGDGASKSYVDAIANGFRLRFAKAVAVSNIALSGLATIDGYTTQAGDVVLLVGQTIGSQNGFWTVGSGAWTRPSFWAAASTIPEGNYAIVDAEGTTYANTKWFITTLGNVVVDTTAVTFSQDTSGASYTAGGGLQLTGNIFSAKLGNAMAVDGSSALTITPATGGLLSVGAGGIGIQASSSSAQFIVSNGSNAPSWVSASGDVTLATTGQLTVNNTAGVGFLKYTNKISNETPTGSVNGSNVTFTLANVPQVSSLELFLNGQLLEPGAGNDYTISANTITMLFAPLSGDKLRAYYLK